VNLQNGFVYVQITNPAPWCHVKWIDAQNQGYCNSLTWHQGAGFRMKAHRMKKTPVTDAPWHRKLVYVAGGLVVCATALSLPGERASGPRQSVAALQSLPSEALEVAAALFNTRRIVAAGHSYGASTTMLIAGAQIE
jgi:hypothetical protein